MRVCTASTFRCEGMGVQRTLLASGSDLGGCPGSPALTYLPLNSGRVITVPFFKSPEALLVQKWVWSGVTSWRFWFCPPSQLRPKSLLRAPACAGSVTRQSSSSSGSTSSSASSVHPSPAADQGEPCAPGETVCTGPFSPALCCGHRPG